jgi:hypothetical protein
LRQLVRLPWAADSCPWVGKLRTVLAFTNRDVIRDSAVQLGLTHQRGANGVDSPGRGGEGRRAPELAAGELPRARRSLAMAVADGRVWVHGGTDGVSHFAGEPRRRWTLRGCRRVESSVDPWQQPTYRSQGLQWGGATRSYSI